MSVPLFLRVSSLSALPAVVVLKGQRLLLLTATMEPAGFLASLVFVAALLGVAVTVEGKVVILSAWASGFYYSI